MSGINGGASIGDFMAMVTIALDIFRRGDSVGTGACLEINGKVLHICFIGDIVR